MCDTFVALPNWTKNKKTIFAKNSDRDPNEPHQIVHIQEMDYQPGEWVECTYIKIPQTNHTNEVYLFKPTWIWGAEMGLNQHGVTIGNEAVFSKIKPGKKPGLIGMDYLRLALERSSSADDALLVITKLLQEYGQSGNCGYHNPIYYHNSFIIADTKKAWVLETVGKEWIAKEVKSFSAISNVYTIGSEFDRISTGLKALAIENKLWKGSGEFNFRDIFSDWMYSTFSDGKNRKTCTLGKLSLNQQLTVKETVGILRSHGDQVNYPLSEKLSGSEVCMHAGWGPIRGNQTTGSLIAEVGPNGITVWFTGASNPCLSPYYPYPLGFEHSLINSGLNKSTNYEEYWWLKERLNRRAIFCEEALLQEYRMQLFQLESEFLEIFDQPNLTFQNQDEVQKLIEQCYLRGLEMTKKWDELFAKKFQYKNRGILYRFAWKNFNKRAKIKL